MQNRFLFSIVIEVCRGAIGAQHRNDDDYLATGQNFSLWARLFSQAGPLTETKRESNVEHCRIAKLYLQFKLQHMGAIILLPLRSLRVEERKRFGFRELIDDQIRLQGMNSSDDLRIETEVRELIWEVQRSQFESELQR